MMRAFDVYLATAATTYLFFAVSDCYDGWEKTWYHQWLTPDQATVAKQRMDKSLLGLASLRKEYLAKAQKLDNKYTVVDFKSSPIKQRLAPLCRLFVNKPRVIEKRLNFAITFDCSCFFVRPNIVMTAAHCVFSTETETTKEGKKKRVPVRTNPEDGFVTFIVRDYGLEGDNAEAHATHTNLHAQLVIEWWTPDAYGYDRFEVDSNSQLAHMDVAFLKVTNPVAKSEHLILTQPVGPLGGEAGAVQCNFFNAPSAMMLGYPEAYKEGEVALSVSGKVQRDSNAGKILFRGNLLGTNWWFTKGSIGGAASGGPIIVGDKTKGMPTECEMGVFGLNHGGFGTDDWECRNYSPLITNQLIQALNIIEKVPLAPNVDAAVEGLKVTKSHKCNNCGFRTVELSVA